MSDTKTYLFVLPDCAPAQKVLDFLADNECDVEVVPIKEADGSRTELADYLQVALSPTLVYTEMAQDDEDDDPYLTSTSRWVGATNCLTALA